MQPQTLEAAAFEIKSGNSQFLRKGRGRARMHDFTENAHTSGVSCQIAGHVALFLLGDYRYYDYFADRF